MPSPTASPAQLRRQPARALAGLILGICVCVLCVALSHLGAHMQACRVWVPGNEGTVFSWARLTIMEWAHFVLRPGGWEQGTTEVPDEVSFQRA